ncbi:MAG: FHA domain-containing protein [Myxococcota bacterium]
MIVCPRCSKDNQPHYKFCLGCGGELPRDAAQQPKSFRQPTPPSGVAAAPAAAAAPQPQFGGAAAGQAPAAPAQPATAPATCPNCGAEVPANFKFCGACGHNMQADAAPAAPSAEPAAPAAEPAGEAKGKLVLIQPDGTEGQAVPVPEAGVRIGREAGPLFAHDTFLSPSHAAFHFRAGQLHVKDEGSLNGVYIRIGPDTPVELTDGSVFRVGQEIIKYESLRPQPPSSDGAQVMGSPDPGYVGRVCLLIGRDTTGNCFPVPPEGIYLGRERGDVLFPEDGYVSGLHCRLHAENGKVYLTDVGSSNGTFVLIQGEAAVPSGSLLLLGQQLFRADY